MMQAKTGPASEGVERGATVAAMVAQVAIDWSVERLERRHHEDDASGRREHGRHGVEGGRVVGRVLQDIEANAGIGAEAGEFPELWSSDVADERVKVRAIRVSPLQALNAGGFDIDRDHGFPVEQRAGKVADTAADFQNSTSEFRVNQARLPYDIV